MDYAEHPVSKIVSLWISFDESGGDYWYICDQISTQGFLYIWFYLVLYVCVWERESECVFVERVMCMSMQVSKEIREEHIRSPGSSNIDSCK